MKSILLGQHMMEFVSICMLSLSMLVIGGCSGVNNKSKKEQQETKEPSGISKTEYGKMEDGSKVYLYTLTNANKMDVDIINYGGIVTAIRTPDKDGTIENVTLGVDSLAK